MAENAIKLKSVNELLGMKFYIPSYQRGYKWRQKDVKYLIEDIAEIREDDLSDYCLQPIVVAKKNDGFILVDGQQRLTTIWLIINWAKHDGFEIDWNFCIEYETRNASNVFLQKIKTQGNAQDEGSCDTHYFSEAISTIEEERDHLNAFFKNLKKNVKIIWYGVDPDEGPAHFERLNSAKIGLTNAELVKAFIMTRSAQDIRAKMACEWDEVEYKLQNEDFFSFITTKDSIYSKEYNRIELLLDLYAETEKANKEKDEYATFNRIVNKVEKEGKDILDVWKDILNIYNRLQSWYNDNYLYNMIGFLVENNGDNQLSDIWKDSQGKSTNSVKELIRKRIIKFILSVGDIRNMVYQNGSTKNILLLFNILSMMSKLPNPKPNEYRYIFNDKFHFDLYKKDNWDKEHVHATASQSLQSKIEWINWMKAIDERLVTEKLGDEPNKKEYIDWIQKANNVVSNEDYENVKNDKHEDFKQFTKEVFAQMYQVIVKALEGEDEGYELKQNSIGNLVLLNANINRAAEYKVAPFSTKRRIIMERVKNGQFVPLGTQNVFMKVYTTNPGHFYRWEKEEAYDGNEKSDRDSYIDAIVEVLNRIK